MPEPQVPVTQLSELVELYDTALKRELENQTDLEEVDVAALAAVLVRHRQMIAEETRAYAKTHHDEMDGATYVATMDVADRIARGDSR